MSAKFNKRIELAMKQFINGMCHYSDDDETPSVYENNGELVAEWWAGRLSALLEERDQEIVEMCKEYIEEVNGCDDVQIIINKIKD